MRNRLSVAIVWLISLFRANGFVVRTPFTPFTKLNVATELSVPQNETIALSLLPSEPSITPFQLPLSQLALAGAAATFFADASMHPMDCVKTLQMSDEGFGLSAQGAIQSIFAQYGIMGFYRGFATYAISDACGGALKFAVYEGWKRKFSTDESAVWVGAALAFLASSVVTVPGELVKQQLQMGRYDDLAQALSSMTSFYTGYDGVLLRDIPYTMLELGLYQLAMQKRSSSSSWWQPILLAAATGGIAAAVTTPFDTIKTKLMVDHYDGLWDCMATTVHDHGAMALWAGLFARVAWIAPSTALYLPTYDFLKQQLEKRQS